MMRISILGKYSISDKSLQAFSPIQIETKKGKKSRECDICDVDVHLASFAKHLRKSKKQLENIKRGDLIIPNWLFEEPVETQPRKI